MPLNAEKIGEVIRQGLLLFSKGIPIPAVSVVSAIAAAVITKGIEVHQKRVSQALSLQLELQHISFVQPDVRVWQKILRKRFEQKIGSCCGDCILIYTAL
jgi:hypothetical protein